MQKKLTSAFAVFCATVLAPACQLQSWGTTLPSWGPQQQQQEQAHAPGNAAQGAGFGDSSSRSSYIVVLKEGCSHQVASATAAAAATTRSSRSYSRHLLLASGEPYTVRSIAARLQQLYTGVKVQHTFSAVFTGLAFSLQYQHHRPQPHVQQNSLLLQSRRPITSQDILALLAADPCITVYPDRRGILRGTAPAPAAAAAAADAASRKPCTAAASSCDIGNSMRRIRAAMGNKVHGAASVGVAVIDTGVAAHPDLNIVQSINCIGSGSSINGYLQLGQSSSCSVLPSHFDHVGHSTLVAGIIGAKSLQVQQQRSFTAKERRRRVTGVAPGTPLFSLHVVQSDASPPKPFYSFTVSDVIAALDWVLLFNAKNTSRQGLGANAKIRVVNLSLGDYSQQQYSGTDGISLVDNPAYPDCGAGHPSVDPWHTAICRVAVDRENGAVVVAAAGNTAEDIQTSVPDRFPEVLSVLAMADQDGKSGGKAFYCPAGDFTAAGNYSTDSYALFSNYVSKGDVVAESHTVAAPGVCIRSTYPYNLGRSGYKTESGCSFAAPHVSGIVALCFGERMPGTSIPAGQARLKEGVCAAAFRSSGALGVIKLLVKNGKYRQRGAAGFIGDADHPVAYKCGTKTCQRHYGYLVNAEHV